LSEKPGFQMLAENCQWWCWCCIFRQSVPDTGTSNREDPASGSSSGSCCCGCVPDSCAYFCL